MKFDIDKYETYFFDFDGVVVDSLSIKTEAFGDLFKEYGSDIVRKVKEYHLSNGGVSRYEKFRYYYEVLLKKPITAEILNDLDEAFSKKVKEKVISAPMIRGVEELLKRLHKDNKGLFVVSGTPEEEIRYIIARRGLSSFFNEVVGSPVTKEENVKMLMGKYCIQASDAVFFGDASSDYKAAAKHGIDFVAVIGEHNQEIFQGVSVYKIDNFMNLT